MHFDRLDISLLVTRGKLNAHAWLKDTSFDTTDGDCANTTDLVDVLKRKTEGFLSGALRGDDVVKSLDKGVAFVPRHVRALLDHVITVPT